MFKIFITAMVFLLLSGCATVLTGTNQAVNLEAIDRETKEDLKKVSCNITDSTGAVYEVTSNPGVVVVSKGNAPLKVSCRQEGYQNYTGVINDNFNPVALLDIFFWPTFFVDIASGAISKYPAHYSVEMKPDEAS